MPAFLSETDAQALWRRAAELQAETGRVSRPPALPALGAAPAPRRPGRRPLQRTASETSSVQHREAGIGDEFVARAAAELGLVSASVAVPATLRDALTGAPTNRAITVSSPESVVPWALRWRGAPGTLEYEVRVDGEALERDLEIAVELIRRAMKQVGVVSRIGRSLSWSSVGDERKVDITIVARGGQTMVRANERLGQLAGGLFGGIMGGVGGGGGGVAMAIGAGSLHSLPIAFAMWASVAGGSYVLARGIYSSVARDRQGQLRRLVMDIAEYIQDGGEWGRGGQRDQLYPPAPPAALPVKGMHTPGVGRR